MIRKCRCLGDDKMTIKKKILGTLLLCINFLLIIKPVYANDVAFDIKELAMDAHIEADGDVLFKDRYTYDVDFLNGMIITVDPGDSSLDDYAIIVETEYYEPEVLIENPTGRPGTYQVTREEDGKTTFKIFFPAENEEVDVIVEYRLNNLVTNYSDTALFSRVIVPNTLDYTVDFKGRILLPARANQEEDFRVWGFGTPGGEIYPITDESNSYIDVRADNVTSSQFVEVLSLFPNSLTPNNTNVIDQPIKQEIIDQQEQRTAQDRAQYEQRQRNQRLLLILSFGGVSLIFIFGFYYYFKKRNQINPSPAHVPEHLYHLPESIEPSVVSVTYFENEVSASDFSATILDLARKGYFELEEIKEKKQGFLKFGYDSTVKLTPIKISEEQLTHIQPLEYAVYEYLNVNNQSVTLDELKTRIESNSRFRKRQNNLWNTFQNRVKVKSEKIYGPIPKEQNYVYSIAITGALLGTFGGLLSAILLGELKFLLLFIVSIILGALLIILAEKRPIMTYEQDNKAKEWRSFKKMLNDIGRMDMREIASLELWDEYLVYAVALGVGDRVLEAMNETYAVEELETLNLPVNFYLNRYLIHQVMANTVNDSIQAASPKPTKTGGFKGNNSGGFGGGFSSGSFGGGGGGGSAGGF